MKWSIERWPANWSIEHKLPVFVSILLLAVVIVLLSIGYGEVRRASRVVAGERLGRATHELADLFQRSGTQQRTQMTTLASDSAVVSFLSWGGRRGRDEALAAMRRIVNDTSSSAAIELWDPNGHLLLRTGRLNIDDRPPSLPTSDSALVGPLVQHDTILYYAVAAAARRGEQPLGTVRQVRRLSLNARARSTMTGLAGGDVSLLLGNADGDPWTDLATIIPAPPAMVRTRTSTAGSVSYQRGKEWKRGSAAPIPGTPWMIIAELPRAVVRAPANAYVRRMTPIAAVILVIGALGAWWGSRRLTTPLRQITSAAEGIAGGDLQPRVSVHGEDELGRLARSFNTMAERVADAQHRLEEKVAERTAELESFSYSVSHDLRAPLRAIHGFARILQEDHRAELGAEAQRLLGIIDQNTLRMGQLIDDLLAFSRLGRQEVSKKHVDMGELARGIVDDVRRTEGDRPLEIAVDALPPASGDRALLRQALGNLVQNAAKFTRGRTPARIEIGTQPDGGRTVYFVKDNGAGFDERYAGKLFGVFQRLHRAEEFEGTGVGLAIVQRIVERHGGRVWAEGKVNEGATFYFTLPRSEG